MKKRSWGLMVAALGMLQLTAAATLEPFEYTLDTTVYEDAIFYSYYNITPGIYDGHTHTASADFHNFYLITVYHRKNSDQFDFLSFNGKVGSMVIPSTILPRGSGQLEFLPYVHFSKTMIDTDDGWECIINYDYRSSDEGDFFRVIDHDGNQLISDSGYAVYSYDGENTYILRKFDDRVERPTTRYWRCRTNISNDAAPRLLAKSLASPQLPMMVFGSTGDYRISFKPSTGGKTTVQLFDMLGKLVFSKNIGEISQPMTFTIPESGMPQSPFIAKISNEKGSVIRKDIPFG